MKIALNFSLVALLALTACGPDLPHSSAPQDLVPTSQTTQPTPAPTPRKESAENPEVPKQLLIDAQFQNQPEPVTDKDEEKGLWLTSMAASIKVLKMHPAFNDQIDLSAASGYEILSPIVPGCLDAKVHFGYIGGGIDTALTLFSSEKREKGSCRWMIRSIAETGLRIRYRRAKPMNSVERIDIVDVSIGVPPAIR